MPQSVAAPKERARNQIDIDELATTDDVARVCRVSKRTVQWWCHHRRIPFLKIGHLVRFRLPDVLRALNRHTVQEVNNERAPATKNQFRKGS
jgi:excisionase family DNA binding protein